LEKGPQPGELVKRLSQRFAGPGKEGTPSSFLQVGPPPDLGLFASFPFSLSQLKKKPEEPVMATPACHSCSKAATSFVNQKKKFDDEGAILNQ